MFESFQDYSKIVLLMFFFKNDVDLLHKKGYLKNYNNRLCLEFKNILLKQNEEYLDCIKIEEAVIDRLLNK